MNESAVTPLVGVWIEIYEPIVKFATELVTPLVGVWIEIYYRGAYGICCTVTPLVGVWIEIVSTPSLILTASMSLPLWECGLKSGITGENLGRNPVTPLVGVWIEIKS